MQRIVLFLTTLLLLSFFDAEAQRRGSSTYESLLRQSDQPSAYSDHIIIPGSDSTSVVGITFRLEYDFIPFLRKRPNMESPSDSFEYFSPVQMSAEIYEGEARRSRRSNSPSGVSIFRETWSDTVWVKTFEDTRSRFDHVQGFMHTELEPGNYHYQLQLARGGSEREQPSQVRSFVIPGSDIDEKNEFILLSNFDMGDNTADATLLNYASNVLYGQDYTLLFKLPDSNPVSDRYRLEIRMGDEDNDQGEVVFSETVAGNQIFNVSSSSLTGDKEEIRLTLQKDSDGQSYAFITVPNSEFQNAEYTLTVRDTESDNTIAQKTIRSRWIDMPVSLYSLDVSIDMLRFIIDESELKEINSGSSSEREQKFREFWTERDPSPETEFNELMTEYYSRIDYAYQNFSSFQTPGYDTDRGKSYILYGPPSNIDRQLLPNQPTREIWEYPNRELVFEAVDGLGEFRLISES